MKADLVAMGLLLAGGVVSGLLFDFYRMLRKEGCWNRLITFGGDLLFSLLVLGILVFFFRKANYLEFRVYLFFTSLTGLILYLMFFSRRVKAIFARFLTLSQYTGRALAAKVAAFFRTVYAVCRLLLSVPYGILRWFGLLVYRFGEAVAHGVSLRRDMRSTIINKRAERKKEQKLQDKLSKKEMKKHKKGYRVKHGRGRKD